MSHIIILAKDTFCESEFNKKETIVNKFEAHKNDKKKKK